MKNGESMGQATEKYRCVNSIALVGSTVTLPKLGHPILRPGRCLLRWLANGSNGVKSFVPGHNFIQLNQEDKRFDPI